MTADISDADPAHIWGDSDLRITAVCLTVKSASGPIDEGEAVLPKTDEKLEQLRTFELFRHLPKKDLPRVADMLGPEVRAEPGEVLTEQGRMESDVYLVVDGTADVLVSTRPVAEIGPGE